MLIVDVNVQAGQSAGHRTLLYGHAVLLRHSHSNMVSTYTAGRCPCLLTTVLGKTIQR